MPFNQPVRILAIGYLLPVKRWEWLLLAIQQLKHKGLNCVVRIAGDGPLRVALEQRATTLGVADRVKFIGHVEEIPRLLADSAFLVHTADAEGCPNAVMEAMACGRAVVATAAGDIPFLLEDGKTGFVLPHDNITAFVDRMEQLSLDRDLCAKMGKAARVKAEREFGLDRLVEETLTAYRSAGWRDA